MRPRRARARRSAPPDGGAPGTEAVVVGGGIAGVSSGAWCWPSAEWRVTAARGGRPTLGGRLGAWPHPSARRRRADRRARLPRLLPALLHVARRAAPRRSPPDLPAPDRRLPGHLRGPGRPRTSPVCRARRRSTSSRSSALPQPRSARPPRARTRRGPRSCSPTTPSPPPPPSTTCPPHGSSPSSACPTGRRRCCSRRSPARSSPGLPRCRPQSSSRCSTTTSSATPRASGSTRPTPTT